MTGPFEPGTEVTFSGKGEIVEGGSLAFRWPVSSLPGLDTGILVPVGALAYLNVRPVEDSGAEPATAEPLEAVAEATQRTQRAANEFADANGRFEGALLSSDEERRNAALARVEDAAAEYVRALRDEVRARKYAAPSFARLLLDPCTQFPGSEKVLASILQYASAPAATASVPATDEKPATAPDLIRLDPIRQEALGWAVHACKTSLTSVDAESILATARMFEAYLTGPDEIAEAPSPRHEIPEEPPR